jgi:EmrB/QacA subfamily drug resistance transporter
MLIVMAQPFAEPCDCGIIAAQPSTQAPGDEPGLRRRTLVLSACVLASAMGFIDGSALSVALPRLRADFSADFAATQWVLNAYVLALSALTLIGGALADHFGKARMLAFGCLGFGLASGACALSPSLGWLVGWRVVQGTAAAVVTPASLALIGEVYPREQRNRAIGIWAAFSALTTAGGPVLGGWLTENFGWPWIFAINPPLALIAIALLAYAPAGKRLQRRFDAIGATILVAGLASLAWTLSAIGSKVDGSINKVTTIAAAIAALVAFAGYALWERSTPDAMTPPRLAANRVFLALNIATFLIYAALSIMFFLMSFNLIDSRGLSPASAGLAFLPFTLGVGLLSQVFGAMADRIGARTMLIAGPLCAGFSFALLACGEGGALVPGVLLPMLLLGISFAVLVAPLTAQVMSSVSDRDEGLASGVNNAVSRIAQLAGIALAAGLASFSSGYRAGLVVAAALAAAGALTIAAMLPKPSEPRRRPR